MTNSLANAIQIEGLTGTAIEIRTQLAADVFTPDTTRRDWTYVSGLLLSVGMTADQVDGFFTGLESITGGISLRAAMLSPDKADFSLPQVQSGIEAAREVLGPITDILKGIGGITSKRWQRAGLGSLPSEAEIQAAQAVIGARQRWTQVRDEVVPPMLTAGKSWAEIRAAITEVD